MDPAARERRSKAAYALGLAGILLVVTVVLSVNWTTRLSVNLLVLAVGVVLTIAVAAVTYVRLNR